jgi:hypothetical protein
MQCFVWGGQGCGFELFGEKELRGTQKIISLILVRVDEFSMSRLWTFKKEGYISKHKCG